LTPSQIGRAERLRTELWERVRVFQERYDLILTPTAAVPPFPSSGARAQGDQRPADADLHRLAMLTYAFTVVGLRRSPFRRLTKSGLPVGLQIVGRWRDEAGVLRAAAAFESAQPWADRRPPDSES